MKDDTLQQLLTRYREGNASDEEIQQLERMTRRDEVFAAASRRAATILRRRAIVRVAAAVAAVAVVGVGIGLLMPRSEAPLLAEAKEMPEVQPPQVADEPVAEENVEAAVAAPPATRLPIRKAPVRQAESAKPAHVDVVRSSEEPTVICNNQCDADSVIGDIWKFLTA